MAKELIILLLAISLLVCELAGNNSSAMSNIITEPEGAYAELVSEGRELVMPVGRFSVHVKEGDSLTLHEDGSAYIGRMSGGKMILFGVLIDVNAAAVADFAALPSIGEKTAAQIVAFRKSNGAFSSLEELTAVKGIGPKTLEKIRPYLTL